MGRNTAIAYWPYAGWKNEGLPYELPLALDDRSRERLDRSVAHGAELIMTDPLKGYDFALDEVKRCVSDGA